MFEKLQTGEKILDSLKPAAIQFTLEHLQEPGDQDVFSLFFSCLYIHRSPREWLIILKYLLWNLMDIVLFIKALITVIIIVTMSVKQLSGSLRTFNQN